MSNTYEVGKSYKFPHAVVFRADVPGENCIVPPEVRVLVKEVLDYERLRVVLDDGRVGKISCSAMKTWEVGRCYTVEEEHEEANLFDAPSSANSPIRVLEPGDPFQVLELVYNQGFCTALKVITSTGIGYFELTAADGSLI